MAGTADVTTNFDNKTELEFRNRLIAKFAIPRAGRFWNAGFEATPRTALYPPKDRVEILCRDVIFRTREQDASASKMGQLLVEWARLEERLLPLARQMTERNVSVRDAIRALVRSGHIDDEIAAGLEEVRRVRNTVAHTPARVEEADVNQALKQLQSLAKRIQVDMP